MLQEITEIAEKSSCKKLSKIQLEAKNDASKYKKYRQNIIRDTSNLDKIGSLLEVGKLFDEVKEVSVDKNKIAGRYGFSAEHTKHGEIPGYILLKITKIHDDASPSVKQNLRVGDFILKVDEKLVCTCNAKDPEMIVADELFENVGNSMKMVIARKLKNEKHDELAKKYRSTKFVELSGKNGEFGVKTVMDGDMVMVSELTQDYQYKPNQNYLSVGDHILSVNNKSVLEFDEASRYDGVNGEIFESKNLCTIEAGEERNPDLQNHEQKTGENDSSSCSEDEDDVISPEEEAMMLKLRRDGRRLTKTKKIEKRKLF